MQSIKHSLEGNRALEGKHRARRLEPSLAMTSNDDRPLLSLLTLSVCTLAQAVGGAMWASRKPNHMDSSAPNLFKKHPSTHARIRQQFCIHQGIREANGTKAQFNPRHELLKI